MVLREVLLSMYIAPAVAHSCESADAECNAHCVISSVSGSRDTGLLGLSEASSSGDGGFSLARRYL